MNTIRPQTVMRVSLYLSIFFVDCSSDPIVEPISEIKESAKIKDYQRIIKRGKIVVLMENKPSSYFIYSGAKMGYEYELISKFAKYINLNLEVKIIEDRNKTINSLQKRKGDIIACNYTVTRNRTRYIQYSIPYIKTKQVLIQRIDVNSKQLKINNPTELKRQHIHIWENSSYYNRLINLQEEIGDTIYIHTLDGTASVESLIEQVAKGEIDYTIAEENIARIISQFYSNIDYSVAISVQQNIAFGLRKESTILKERLDKWLDSFLTTDKHKYIYKKYYERKVPEMNPNNTFSSVGGKQLSIYDIFFRRAAEIHDIDWQLCAAVAYQESKFNPQAKGFGGAYGIMQFMPNTGPNYEVYPESSPEVQINGGTKKIKADLKAWKQIPDRQQQIKFALASYNAGRGHVEDAQRLAKKYKLNEKKWDDNVEKMMGLLSQPKYHNDKVVKYGFTRGNHTCKYVREVFERYQEWKTIYSD